MNRPLLTRIARDLNGMARAVPSDGFVQISLRPADALMVAEACDFLGQCDRVLHLPVSPRQGDMHVIPDPVPDFGIETLHRRARIALGCTVGVVVLVLVGWPAVFAVLP